MDILYGLFVSTNNLYKSSISYMKWYDTVDGRNPAPVDR